MKALVLFSGGIDSTTALGLAIQKYGKDQVIALSVSYGQKHDKEIKAAIAVAQYYGVEHLFLDLSKIFQYSNCSLLQQSTEDIPEESYAEQISKTNGDKPVSTYVPFRNGLFLSSAASIALSKDCEVIYYGAHADDSAGFAYPDCSPVFNQAMNEAIWEGSGHQLKIEAPFVNVSKAEVVRIGLELGVPYELTWSCYEGGEKPCGKSGIEIEEETMREKENLTLLGNQQTEYSMDYNPSVLEAFQNKHPENDYFVKFNCPEFTSLCPITGQPDFATITISYVPDERLVESKSLKLYLFSFRNHGDFHEDVINIIMKDLVSLLEPKYIEVWGKFLPRGGLSIDPYCNYGKPGTDWEKVAWNRMSNHDMFPEKVDNR